MIFICEDFIVRPYPAFSIYICIAALGGNVVAALGKFGSSPSKLPGMRWYLYPRFLEAFDRIQVSRYSPVLGVIQSLSQLGVIEIYSINDGLHSFRATFSTTFPGTNAAELKTLGSRLLLHDGNPQF